MMTKRGEAKSAVAFFVILLIGIIVFIVMLQPKDKEKLIPGYKIDVEPYSNTLLNATQILLKTSNETTIYSNISLEPVTLDGIPKNASERIANGFEVYRSWLLYNKPEEISFDADETLVRAKLSIDVGSRERDGELLIFVNDRKVHSGVVSAGNLLVTIPSSAIRRGTNKVRFETTKPSWPFQKNKYKIDGVILLKDIFDKSAAEMTRTFAMAEEDVRDLQKATLSLDMLQKSRASKRVTVTLNNKSLYGGDVPTEERPLIDVPLDTFASGTNEMHFTTAMDGAYEIKDILFSTTVVRSNETGKKTYIVNVADNDWPKVKDKEDYECPLTIEKSSGVDDKLMIIVNTNSDFSYSFSNDNKITFNLCSGNYLKQGDNTITLKAYNEVTLSSVTLLVKNKAAQ